MTKTAYLQSRRSRLGEVALWATAAMLTLTVHAGAAYYLLQEPEEPAGDSAPPAAIMIELAALPEAVQTEDTVEANDQVEQQEVMSNVTEPVEEPVPEEPQPEPEPVPEPVVEEPPPTPAPRRSLRRKLPSQCLRSFRQNPFKRSILSSSSRWQRSKMSKFHFPSSARLRPR